MKGPVLSCITYFKADDYDKNEDDDAVIIRIVFIVQKILSLELFWA